MSITTVIPQRRYKGVTLTAFRTRHCGKNIKYTIAFIGKDGSERYTGSDSVADANAYFEKNPEIKKMVLYIYHPKKEEFEVRKYYERNV